MIAKLDVSSLEYLSTDLFTFSVSALIVDTSLRSTDLLQLTMKVRKEKEQEKEKATLAAIERMHVDSLPTELSRRSLKDACLTYRYVKIHRFMHIRALISIYMYAYVYVYIYAYVYVYICIYICVCYMTKGRSGSSLVYLSIVCLFAHHIAVHPKRLPAKPWLHRKTIYIWMWWGRKERINQMRD